MKKFIIILSLIIFSKSLADEKPGRFFKDQPDVTNEPQIHFI